MSIITANTFKAEIYKLAQTAKAKADDLDEAFLAKADPRAVQGGAIDAAAAWRDLSDALRRTAREARVER